MTYPLNKQIQEDLYTKDHPIRTKLIKEIKRLGVSGLDYSQSYEFLGKDYQLHACYDYDYFQDPKDRVEIVVRPANDCNQIAALIYLDAEDWQWTATWNPNS